MREAGEAEIGTPLHATPSVHTRAVDAVGRFWEPSFSLARLHTAPVLQATVYNRRLCRTMPEVEDLVKKLQPQAR